MPEQKVEKYKITSEMKDFLKNYKKFKELGEVLSNALQIQLGEADMTRKMLQEVEGTKELLLQAAPKKATFELEGQEELGRKQEPQQQKQFDPRMRY
jgi:hypothetical protein